MKENCRSALLLVGAGLVFGLSAVFGQLPEASGENIYEFYQEDPFSGLSSYYSKSFYEKHDPNTGNYKRMYYDPKYGTTYFWKDYSNNYYTENIYNARYGETDYYTNNQHEDLIEWGVKITFILSLAVLLGCCLGICCCCYNCIDKKVAEQEDEMMGVIDDPNETDANREPTPIEKMRQRKKKKNKGDQDDLTGTSSPYVHGTKRVYRPTGGSDFDIEMRASQQKRSFYNEGYKSEDDDGFGSNTQAKMPNTGEFVDSGKARKFKINTQNQEEDKQNENQDKQSSSSSKKKDRKKKRKITVERAESDDKEAAQNDGENAGFFDPNDDAANYQYDEGAQLY